MYKKKKQVDKHGASNGHTDMQDQEMDIRKIMKDVENFGNFSPIIFQTTVFFFFLFSSFFIFIFSLVCFWLMSTCLGPLYRIQTSTQNENVNDFMLGHIIDHLGLDFFVLLYCCDIFGNTCVCVCVIREIF